MTEGVEVGGDQALGGLDGDHDSEGGQVWTETAAVEELQV